VVAETCKRTTRQVHARLDELAGIARPAFWEAEGGLSMTASDWTQTPLGTQTARFDTRKLLSVDFSTLAVAIDEGHTAIESHPVLLHTENPCRDGQWQPEWQRDVKKYGPRPGGDSAVLVLQPRVLPLATD
jgi:hypothetical protein